MTLRFLAKFYCQGLCFALLERLSILPIKVFLALCDLF